MLFECKIIFLCFIFVGECLVKLVYEILLKVVEVELDLVCVK